MMQRLCRAIKPGYAVVGKTRVSLELEGKLIELARHGKGKESMGTEPHFLYLPDFTSRGTQHVFGSVRLAKRGGVTGADYIAHFLVLTEEEVHSIWQKGGRLTPAGVLLTLELRGFWAQSWRGTAKWLTNEGLPNWMEAEAELQAQVQPTWQHYTGHKRFAALLKEPQYREACMLALPVGTPMADMLGLLHEADYLRSDLGWGVPIFTRGGEEIMDLPQVQMLGFIGSRMHQQAMLAGLPVIEVTEQLSSGLTVQNAQLTPPPVFTTPQVVENFSQRIAGHKKSEFSVNVFSKLLKMVGAIIFLGAVAFCLRYVWQNSSEQRDKLNELLTQIEGSVGGEQAPKELSAVKSSASAEPLTDDEEELARRRIVPVMVGRPIPGCVKCFFSTSGYTLSSGRVSIYRFLSDGKAVSLSRELDGRAYRAVIAPEDPDGTWTLELMEEGVVISGGALTLTMKGDMLQSITDEDGQNVALLLPVCKNEVTIGKVLLLPEMQVKVPEITDKKIEERVNGVAMLTPECLTVDSQKLVFSPSPQAKKWEQSWTGEVHCTASDLLCLPAVAERNNVVLEGDDTGFFRFPMQGEKRGEMICYSPELKIRYDFGQSVISSVLSFANASHSSKGQKKQNSHSIAGIWHVATRVLTAPKDKKTEALAQYARLFADAEFAAFCEKELSYMAMPHHGSVTGEGTHIKVDPTVMKRLMTVNFLDVRRCLCERLTQEARSEFSRLLKQGRASAAPSGQLFLRDVQLTAPDEITWFWGVRKAE